jgi:hypothetical protein
MKRRRWAGRSAIMTAAAVAAVAVPAVPAVANPATAARVRHRGNRDDLLGRGL